MKLHRVFLIIVFLLLSSVGWDDTFAQSEREEYFKETGHTVTGEFYDLYTKTPNYLLLYGYPITDAFLDPRSNQLIQYFQKSRFELDLQAPQGQRVKASPLGSYLYQPGKGEPLIAPGSFSDCRTFPETGFKVCGAFLEFFEANNGLEVFGYPISNAETLSGTIVQHFENTRFEWHPEFPNGNRVILTNLGLLYFYEVREDPAHLPPKDGGDIIKGVLNLKVRAYPEQAVTSLSGRQTVHVIVQDQRLLPVSDVDVSLMIHLPGDSDSIQRLVVPYPTNQAGIVGFEFEYEANEIGDAEIEVIVRRDHLEAHTITSFRVWW